jgi:hypothetical protein
MQRKGAPCAVATVAEVDVSRTEKLGWPLALIGGEQPRHPVAKVRVTVENRCERLMFGPTLTEPFIDGTGEVGAALSQCVVIQSVLVSR